MQCLQKRHVTLTSFDCCCADSWGDLQSPNRWRSCKLEGKMGKGEMGCDKGYGDGGGG